MSIGEYDLCVMSYEFIVVVKEESVYSNKLVA